MIKADFSAFLVRGQDPRSSMRILKGSENMETWPGKGYGRKGILTYGTQKINIFSEKVSALKISKDDAGRVDGLGWTVMKTADSYCYIVRTKEEASK